MTKKALEKLPPRIAESCRNAASLCSGRINEIRLRKGSLASLTIRGENIVLGISATEAELEESVRTFCEVRFIPRRYDMLGIHSRTRRLPRRRMRKSRRARRRNTVGYGYIFAEYPHSRASYRMR